jgi:hypothetical protein
MKRKLLAVINNSACSLLCILGTILLTLTCIPVFSEDGNTESQFPIVYLTYQDDPTTSITIHWITDLDKQDTSVSYREMNDLPFNLIYAEGTNEALPDDFPYRVHTVKLNNLSPGQSYSFSLLGHDDQTYSFRTVPDTLDKPLTFVTGGDMYHGAENLLRRTNHAAAQEDPYFVLAGGDICYATDKLDLGKEHIERWILFFKAYSDEFISSEGHLIPIVPALGNHDVKGRYYQDESKAQLFHSFFSFPGVQAYRTLDFAEYMSIVVLDSGHTNSVEGAQLNWLKDQLQEREDQSYLFTLYHVPAYIGKNAKNTLITKIINKYWTPIFDMFKVNAAFENHEHIYKRTHPLLAGEVNEEGTIYIGGGAWGTLPRVPMNPEDEPYLAKTASTRHFLKVTVNKDRVKYESIDENGNIFDQTEQKSRVLLNK